MNSVIHKLKKEQYILKMFCKKDKIIRKKYKKKEDCFYAILFNINLAAPAFPVRRQTSIIGNRDLTSVFGMETGVSLYL